MISSHKIYLYIITIELSLNTCPLIYTHSIIPTYTVHTIYILSKIRKTHVQLRKITLTKSRVPNTGQLSSTCTFDVILSEN